jgi:hypothetical protein
MALQDQSNMTTGEPMSEFPSQDFAQRAELESQKLETAKSEVEKLQDQLDKFRQKAFRAAHEVAGKDPDAEIARTKQELVAAESAFSRAKDAMYSMFALERSHYEPTREALWRDKYLPIVTTAAEQFATAVATLQRISRELAALEEPPVAGSASISALDADASAHNQLAAKFRLPSNFLIASRESLAAPFEHAVRQMLAKSNLLVALKELRLHLGLEDQPQGVLVEKLASRNSMGGTK